MAHVKGKPGSHLVRDALRRVMVAFTAILVLLAGTVFLLGFVIGAGQAHWLLTLLVPIAMLFYYLERHYVRTVEKRIVTNLQGARGEWLTANKLEMLANCYRVFNNVAATNGDLDHVVVGPSGIFAIETKNWRGVIQSNAKGKLIQNTFRKDDRSIPALNDRIRWLKDRFREATGEDHCIEGLMVFPISFLEVNWKDTQGITCLRLDQLCEHIERKRREELSDRAIAEIARVMDSLVNCHAEDR